MYGPDGAQSGGPLVDLDYRFERNRVYDLSSFQRDLELANINDFTFGDFCGHQLARSLLRAISSDASSAPSGSSTKPSGPRT